MTLQMMMRNEYVVDAKLYRKEKVAEGNSALLKALKDNHYSFCYIGLDKYSQWFPEEDRCDEEFSYMPCAPYIQWLAMKKLYRAEDKMCLILHYIAETHTPFWSGYAAEVIGDDLNHSRMPEEIKEDIPLCRQCKESRAYMDDRLDDFLGYIGRNTEKNTMIYLSDHGKFAGSGKTTIGSQLYYRMRERKGSKVVILDGDVLKGIVGNDTGYSYNDRLSRAKRYSNLCKFLVDQGIDVIICTIAMFDSVRDWNRKYIEKYIEVFLDVPTGILVKRNKKGLWGGNGQRLWDATLRLNFPKIPIL